MEVKFEVVPITGEIAAFNLLMVPPEDQLLKDAIDEWIAYVKKNLADFESALEDEEFVNRIEGKTLREVVFRED